MTLKRYKQIIIITALAAGLSLALSLIVWLSVYRQSNVEVVFLDIGQGDSILIKTKYNQQILIDGGPDAKVLGRLGRNLPFYDHDLDLVIATHPDADHVAGLVDVLRRYQVSTFLEPGIKHDTGIFAALQQAVDSQQIEHRYATGYARYDLGDNLWLDILFPDHSLVGQTLANTNDASIVARLTDGQVDYLLTGDAPLAVEAGLAAAYGAAMGSEVLKLGHHGSNTSSGDDFLDAVKPEAAVISSGRNNRYGHPHPAVLNRLKKRAIPALRTDEMGDIRLRSDGEFVELIN